MSSMWLLFYQFSFSSQFNFFDQNKLLLPEKTNVRMVNCFYGNKKSNFIIKHWPRKTLHQFKFGMVKIVQSCLKNDQIINENSYKGSD
jgi:hypothetical protein